MANPTMQNIPGMDAMNGTLDFVKNLWGGMSMPSMKLPGMIMPTLSVDEINKQVADLKAVESWLTLNLNMLKSTIQALEVQSATISTLQAMGESLSAAVTPPAREDRPAEKAPEPVFKAESKPVPEPEPERKVEPAEAKSDSTAPPPGGSAVPLANPALWWNMLQDQFKQAVGSAMAGEVATKPADKAAAKPASKPAPRTVAKPAPKSAQGTASKTGPKAAPKSAAKAKPVPRKAAVKLGKPLKRVQGKQDKET